jgi:hypothetical protein
MGATHKKFDRFPLCSSIPAASTNAYQHSPTSTAVLQELLRPTVLQRDWRVAVPSPDRVNTASAAANTRLAPLDWFQLAVAVAIVPYYIILRKDQGLPFAGSD